MDDFGNVYRPPFEHRSFLLPVTVGCSHNKCAFCTMYRDVPFRVLPMEQVEAYINQAVPYANRIQRVFLENGDPFVLSAERLEAIALLIREKLPRMETIAMYASIPNILSKTDEELKMLRQLGINELNIGVESGLDEALVQMNKGYTAREALDALLRLKEAGIDYGANVIFGAAGPEWRIENALQTAHLINATEPYLIFTGTIHADPGCVLYDQIQRGEFIENTVGQYLEEEETSLQALDARNCLYFGLHPSNIVGLYGNLAYQKEKMLLQLQQKRRKLTQRQLRSVPERGSEGAILLQGL